MSVTRNISKSKGFLIQNCLPTFSLSMHNSIDRSKKNLSNLIIKLNSLGIHRWYNQLQVTQNPVVEPCCLVSTNCILCLEQSSDLIPNTLAMC